MLYLPTVRSKPNQHLLIDVCLKAPQLFCKRPILHNNHPPLISREKLFRGACEAVQVEAELRPKKGKLHWFAPSAAIFGTFGGGTCFDRYSSPPLPENLAPHHHWAIQCNSSITRYTLSTAILLIFVNELIAQFFVETVKLILGQRCEQ